MREFVLGPADPATAKDAVAVLDHARLTRCDRNFRRGECNAQAATVFREQTRRHGRLGVA